MLQPKPGCTLDPQRLNDLLDLVAKEAMIDRSRLTLEARLDSLGVKSADLLIVLMAVEEKFGVYIPVDDSLSDAETVGNLVDALAAHLPKAET